MPAPPQILSESLIADLAAVVAKGNFRYVACQQCGISKATFSTWITRGKKHLRERDSGEREELTLQAKLVLALDFAEAQVHSELICDVIKGDNKDKRWYLEHRYNKLYNKNPNIVIDDEETIQTIVDPRILLTERLKQFLSGALTPIDEDTDEEDKIE